MNNYQSFFNQKFISENQQIILPVLEEKNIELFIKREDIIHPFISGNKFRKLKYNIEEAKIKNKTTLLTFGGAFSNHILATAVAGALNGFKTVGVIRGDELGNNLEKTLAYNATLREAHNNGMVFEFISRDNYRNKLSKVFIDSLIEKYNDFYLIPEGGSNNLAVKGCQEILQENDNQFNYICVAVGTGGTIAGLINAANSSQKVIGFPALKGNFLYDDIKRQINTNNFSLETDYNFGGYAKYNEKLILFINQFKEKTGVLLDPIYTGKMIFGIMDLIKKNKFKRGSKILAIHTGGIQGIEGFNKKLKNKNQQIINYL